MPPKCYCVFEAVNHRRREAVVGVTEFCDADEVRQAHARLPPVWMSRWDTRDAEYKMVRQGLSIREAFAAATAHAADSSLAKLSVHVIG